MKTLDYYFIKEYQWKTKWVSEIGGLKVKVNPTNEFIQKFNYIDFNIIGQIFTSKKEFYNTQFVDSIITEIKKVISFERTSYLIGSEIVLLEVGNISTRPIDMIGDAEGLEVPLSWNVSTPIHLQYIPTSEILNIFEDWLDFLIEAETR